MNPRSAVLLSLVAACCSACNEHPVAFVATSVVFERSQTTPVDGIADLDILWVIDNSGSMCQEQRVLRENFDRFIDAIDDATVDFHIAVTTTHMTTNPDLPDSGSSPGHLQAAPQPLPGFDPACYTATDAGGENIAGDYAPIRDAVAAARACSESADIREFTDDEIACALGERTECAVDGVCEAGGCSIVHLFPDPSTYRPIPLVLRSEDYRTEGGLDAERLRADFACMSFVGTRGHGFERGLAAAVAAVSPELTLGDGAPNAGFVRPDAAFGVVFVTDENDCSDDGTLSEATSCGDNVCDYFNHPDAVDSPLIDPGVLREQLLANLRATKGRDDFPLENVFAASIHGNSRRYAGDVIPGPECRSGGPDQIPSSSCGAFDACDVAGGGNKLAVTCATELGRAYSGDRYDRFLRGFADGNFYPPARDADTPLTGWMCSGDFRPALEAIGELIRPAAGGCITGEIKQCDGPGASCPDHPDGTAGDCVPRGDVHYCDSYVAVEFLTEDVATLDRLQTSGYCGELVVGGCIVDRARYTFAECSGVEGAIKLQWNDETEAKNLLVGGDLNLRWRVQ